MDSILSFLVPIILVVLVLLVLAANVRVVPQSRAFVIERLGAFQGVWGVGLHFKIPFIERVAKNVSLKEQVVDFPPQPVITKDNVTMQIDTVIYFQITDPKLYTYGVENPMSAIENLTATTLRNIIGDLELDQSLTSRDHINGQMRAILDEATDNWGIKVNRVELKRDRSSPRSWWPRARSSPPSCGLTRPSRPPSFRLRAPSRLRSWKPRPRPRPS